MNKLKRLVPLLASVFLAVTCCVTGCTVEDTPSGPNDPNEPIVTPEITTDLVGLEVNTENAKTEFYVGENFSSANLVVTATTKRSDQSTTRTLDVSSSAKINSNAFRKRIGEYPIKVSYTVGTTTKEDTYYVRVKDVQIEFDVSDVKTTYLVGEEFNIDNAKVWATTSEYNIEPVRTDITENRTSLTIDDSAVDNSQEGVYPVTARYALPDGVVRTASFDITYEYPKDALEVTLAEGVSNIVYIDADNPTATIDPSAIVVRHVDEYGFVDMSDDGLIDITDENVTVKLYNANKEVLDSYYDSASGKYTNLPGGTYQIWVETPSQIVEGYKLTNFALIYVVDEIKTFKFKSGTTSQEIGVDVMTQTWVYEVTTATGETREITSANVTVTNLVTLSANSGKATVTYIGYGADGSKQEMKDYVDYNVTKGADQTERTESYNFHTIEGYTDGTPLTSDDFTGNDSFISEVDGGIVNYRTTTDAPGFLDVQNDALQITFKGVGELSIIARGPGNSSSAIIGVKRIEADGTEVYMSASYTSVTDYTVTEMTFENGKMYEVVGKVDLAKSNPIKFVIDKAGTYVIFTVSTDPDGSTSYKTTRVYGISVKDIYKTETTALTASGNELYYDDRAERV